MTDGYIDSSSAYEVVSVLSGKRPNESHGWAWRSALSVSSALINCRYLKLAPAPGLAKAASGPYGRLMISLSDLIVGAKPDQQVEKSALHKTKRWANDNVAKVRDIHREMEADETNFSKWLDWVTAHAWMEHSTRLDGLFDLEFIPEISRVLNVPINYLKDVHQLSRDLNVLNYYTKHRPIDKDDFRVMSDAYTISVLLRGRYHDYVAQESSRQIMHHPIRKPMLPRLIGKPRTEFTVSNTEQYLSTIILSSAFAERGTENRITSWAENIRKARSATLAGAIDLRSKDYDEVALDLAVRAAKRLDIRTHSKLTESVLDAAVTLALAF